MAKIRAHIIISGRVQGVFFRYTMEQVASKFDVTGWAKNRFDGKVEAVLEGDKKNVEKVIEWSHNGPPGAVVENVEVDWGKYTGEFNKFLYSILLAIESINESNESINFFTPSVWSFSHTSSTYMPSFFKLSMALFASSKFSSTVTLTLSD